MNISKEIRDRLFWSGHIIRNAPSLVPAIVSAALAARIASGRDPAIICIGTHHKVLTVFLSRVFRSFAAITGRQYSIGTGAEIDYQSSVLIDHHSAFLRDAIRSPFCGLHVTRDPRDLVVSSAFYHTKSSEAWLHKPMDVFEGKTYQEMILSLPNTEARLIFEIDNAAGFGIREMLNWQPCPEISEVRYDQLVTPKGDRVFSALIAPWPLALDEKRLLVELFRYFSLGNPGARQTRHIRNAASGQWRAHFTPAVISHFHNRFPDAVERLGYPPD